MRKKQSTSLAIDPEVKNKIKQLADRRKVSFSRVVCDLVDNFSNIDDVALEKIKSYSCNKNIDFSKVICDLVDKFIVLEEDITPVVLKIPNKLKQSEPELEKWLNLKASAIVKALCVKNI